AECLVNECDKLQPRTEEELKDIFVQKMNQRYADADVNSMASTDVGTLGDLRDCEEDEEEMPAYWAQAKEQNFRFNARGSKGNPMGGKWQRYINNPQNAEEKKQYEAKKGDTEAQQQHRQQWLRKNFDVFMETHQHTKAKKKRDYSEARYLVAGRVVVEEGGGAEGCRNAANYCLACVAVGFPWVKWCSRRKAALYLYKTEGIEDEVTETWEHTKKMYLQRQLKNMKDAGAAQVTQVTQAQPSEEPVQPRKPAALEEETAAEANGAGGVQAGAAASSKAAGASKATGQQGKRGPPSKATGGGAGSSRGGGRGKARRTVKVSAQSVLTQINRDPGWSSAKEMQNALKPMQNALKQLDGMEADHDVFPSIVSSNDLSALRAKWNKKNKVDQFDRYLAEFSEKFDPVVRALQLETRMLTSQKLARDQEMERIAKPKR
ncbi:unnamed protein product, partial [Prorocentrum cordatum]